MIRMASSFEAYVLLRLEQSDFLSPPSRPLMRDDIRARSSAAAGLRTMYSS